ncbi:MULTISPECIES: hypothetical protein [Legionella]|nr:MULTISPECIES: hypothetical protein [Legionella]
MTLPCPASGYNPVYSLFTTPVPELKAKVGLPYGLHEPRKCGD